MKRRAGVRHPSGERGVALPLSILIVTVLSLILAVGLVRSNAERRSSADHAAQVDALAIAQSGLELFRSTSTAMPATLPWTQTYTFANGSATVTVYRVRDVDASGNALFLAASLGRSTAGRRYDAQTPDAERTVSQYFAWSGGPTQVIAAFTSLSGILKDGPNGSFDGNDQCPVSPQPPVAGAAVPTSGSSPFGYGGLTGMINGVPPNAPLDLGSVVAATSFLDLDWGLASVGGTFRPDFVIDNTVSPATGTYPDPLQMNSWPVVLVRGDFTPPADGKGILIVTGDLVMSGVQQWYGLVLVGGELDVAASSQVTVLGRVVTGLNRKIGIGVANRSHIQGGNNIFAYHSCYLDSAMVKFRGLSALASTWSDNWPSY